MPKSAARDTVELLRLTAEMQPDREAFVELSRRMTFAEWDRAADGLAATFAAAGVRKGGTVVLVLPSCIEYAVSYQAAMRLGAVTSGINPRLGPVEKASILERTSPAVVVVGDIADLPGEWRGGGTALRVADLAATYTDRAPSLPSLDPTDPVAIVWTSGTTGAPKGAVFGHRNLEAVAIGAGELGAPLDRRFSPVPFSHVGYMTRPWEEIAKVITSVIPPTPWRADETLLLLERERVTVGQGVPTQWRLVLDLPQFDDADLSALRIAGTGAASVPPDLVREMQRRLGCPVVLGYTSTEAAITTGSVPGDPPELICRTVGKARVNVDLEVVDGDDRAVTAGEVGRVRCRSGAVMQGYWHDDERTASVLDADGWLHTGDLGSLDGDGYLTLAGRQSEMYIRGGYNVYPVEVEHIIASHPDVADIAVVSRPDPVLGDIGVAFVVPAANATPTIADVRAWSSRSLADYKAPDMLVLVDELPLTPMRKVDKLDLAERARRLERVR
ncbi:MAG TPA: class I adenylate-forming enzyme family protein [Acidimicrobiales bacterium]|jgi:acyl-CoA synthetase (AMP-forming)/AMP-acid ligase II